jgi:hypothetical protein
MQHEDWPELRLSEWEPTYLTLHRWLQIVGKVRLALSPPLNHWWHVPLYVTPEGLTTSTVPFSGGCLSIVFDFVAHKLTVTLSDARAASFPLEPMTVAEFYAKVTRLLAGLGVDVHIRPIPVEVVDQTPFPEDTKHRSYDRVHVERVHRILLSSERVFSRFRSTFIGKSSPVHLFWGAFDLAVTRFSGRRNLDPPKDRVMRAAYSHEVISHGFWPGGDWPTSGRVEEAVFYSYALPEPEGFRAAEVAPPQARYDATLGEFVLPYEAVRTAADPDAVLLAFMESTYRAAADRAGWPRQELDAQDPLAVRPADGAARSAREVFEDHLALAQARRFDEDIEKNFADDCVVMAKGKVQHGHDALRDLARQLEVELPSAKFDYVTKAVDRDVCFLEWTAEDASTKVLDGADSFVVRNGKIVAQTIHYTVVPRA